MTRRITSHLRGGAALAAVMAMAAVFLELVPASAETPPPPPSPVAVTNTLSALAQTAAIVEGTVTQVRSEYAADTGPWTNVTLSDLVVHRGEVRSGAQPSTLVLTQRGGERPDGRVLKVSHVPQFVAGARYVVFLRNTSWNLSPVLNEVALRVETAEDGRTLLVGPDQGAVIDLNPTGLRFSAPLYSKSELTLAAPQRLAREPAPAGVFGTQDLLRQVDALSNVLGVGVSGHFYAQPASKAKRLPVAAPTGAKANLAAESESSTVDSSGLGKAAP